MPSTVVPDLATVVGVELARTGSWAISSGDWTPTRDDFVAAVAARGCPAVRPPVIKLGHVDPRFDGQPAVGSIENLRTEYGGHSLVGDLDGMPAWLANRDTAGRSVLSSAFPSRSVEGTYNYTCQLGHTHPFVLTGLALLGVTPPGVGTLRSLRDVAGLYGVAAEVEPATGESRVSVTFRAAAQVHTGAMIALVPTAEHAARLAVEGGEPLEQLHLTLAYLGEAAAIDESTRRATITALATAMAGAGSVDADGFAISVFNPSNDERDTCIVLGVSGSEADDAQSLTLQTLAQVPGLLVPQQHTPWVAHVTLRYTDDLSQVAALADRTGPISFDRLRIAFGGAITDIPLGTTTIEARYDPEQLRDPGGEGGGQWVSTGGGSSSNRQDRLRLASRIDLAPGERLISSDRVDGDAGGARLALTERQDGRRMLRLGLGGEDYGRRDRDNGIAAWDGNPPHEPMPEAERQRLRAEQEALEEEFESASSDREDAIDERLAEIREQLTDSNSEFNGTAVLDEYSWRRLADRIRPALQEAIEQHQTETAAWAEIERLQEAGGYDDDRMAELHRIARADDMDYITFAEGIVAGSEWGDVHFEVEMADGEPYVLLGVTPKGAPDDWGDTLDWQGRFDVAEMRKLLRLLDKLTSVAATFDPHQRRNADGEWTDGGADAPSLPEAPELPGMTWEQVHDSYGESYDEATAADFTVAVFSNGDFTLFFQNEHGRFEALRELTPDDANGLADHLDWAARLDELQDGGHEPTEDLVDYLPADEAQSGLIGYSGDGEVHMRFSTSGEYVPDMENRDNPAVDSFAFSADDAADLAQALRDMADRHDELETGNPVAASTRGLDSTVPAATTSIDANAVRAAWNSMAPDAQWVAEIAPDMSYVVIVTDPARTFARHQVHVSARGQITFGRARPIRLGYVDASGAVTAARTVFASRDESRPPGGPPEGQPAPTTPPPAGGVPVSPAAEPEPTTEPKEDPVSTLSDDMRSRLGLTEGADEAAALAAIDALKVKAETPAPDPAQVAASAAAAAENTELRKEVQVLASKMETVTAELAQTKADKAATVKASVLGEAKRLGKFAPADADQWSTDYDDAPGAVTRLLERIAPGTAVPVSASGVTGPAEPTGTDDDFDALMARLDGPLATGQGV